MGNSSTGCDGEASLIPTRPKRRRWLRRILGALLVLLALPVLAYLSFIAAVAFWPYPTELERARSAGTWIEDRRGTPLAAFVAEDGQWQLPLEYEQVSPHLLDAIVAVEDWRFYQHNGVDWKAAAGAAWENVTSLGIRRGASTLSMQVHRLRRPEARSFAYKIEQAIRARQLEERLTKRQILLEYVNRAPFGGNLVGAGAASWRYFGRACKDLSLGQAALLAGLPQNPNRYRPDRYPGRAKSRRDHVLARMAAAGLITETQRQEAAAEPLDARWRPLPQVASAPRLPPAAGAMPTLANLARRYPGQSMRLTIDSAVQRMAAEAARQHLEQIEPSGATAAAVVVLDTESGECLAAVSLSRDRPAVDLTRSARSPGSALKPFIYAAAFDMGIASPTTILRDSPMVWPGYMPGNFDRSFRGNLTAAEALAESRNIPALLLLSEVGVERATGILGAFGVRSPAQSPQRYGLSLAIGGAEATPMEMAEAYATLARGGVHKPATIASPERRVGLAPPSPGGATERSPRRKPWVWSTQASRVGLAPPSPGGAKEVSPTGSFAPAGANVPSSGNCSVLSERACWQTLVALSSYSRTANVSPAAAKLHVAWKTGTSSGYRDAWCAAMTRQRTVVVWLGNANGRGAHCLVGQEAAAPLALQIIAAMGGDAQPWPGQAQPSPTPQLERVAPVRRLALLSPMDGAEFVYNTDLPADRQQVLLRAAPASRHMLASSDQADTLWWFIDGQPAGTTAGNQKLFWPPSVGRHEIRVVDAEGHFAVARIRVR